MIIYGYVKDYYYATDGTLKVKVRIPNIHGPWTQTVVPGQKIRNYVRDKDLPYFTSVLLHHLPVEGEVVALQSISESANDFIVIGLTGGSYFNQLDPEQLT